jgi:predicted Rdx family selenoprotein
MVQKESDWSGFWSIKMPSEVRFKTEEEGNFPDMKKRKVQAVRDVLNSYPIDREASHRTNRGRVLRKVTEEIS